MAIGSGIAALTAATAVASEPSVTVSPSSGLDSGQSVTISGSGLPGSGTVGAVTCNTFTDPATASCDIADANTTASDAEGNFTLQLTVVSSFSGVNPANGGQPAGQVDCSVAPGCTVYIGTDSGISVPVAISFR